MKKIFTWLKVNAASILGITQAIIKVIKEVITAILNILSLFLRTYKAQALTIEVRDIVNVIDDFIEKIKLNLIPKV